MAAGTGRGKNRGKAGSKGNRPSKSSSRKKKDSVLVICAHSDDQIFGVGGTLAKYAEEGGRVIIVVLSYGEKSHPWLKKKVTVRMRVKESHEAAKIIGAERTIFFGMREGNFPTDFVEMEMHEKTRRLIRKYKPSKIFTHSGDDPLPDHTAVNKFVVELCDEIGYNGDLYSFDVWNPLKIRERNVPKLYVDITKTFRKKTKALKCFESQWLSMLSLLWSVYYRAIKHGLKAHCLFAEVFHKIR